MYQSEIEHSPARKGDSKRLDNRQGEQLMGTATIKVRLAALAVLVLTVLSAAPAQAAPGDDKGPRRAGAAKVDDRLAPDHAAHAKVLSSPAATAALATIQTRIGRYVATQGGRYTFASYLDSTPTRRRAW
jgi:hypothetical protein